MTKNNDVKIYLKDGRILNEVWERFTFPFPQDQVNDLIKFAKPEELEPFINLALRVAVKDDMFKHVNCDDMDSDFSILIRLPTSVIEKLGVSPYRKAAKILTMIQLFDKYKNLRWRDWVKPKGIIIHKELKDEINGRKGKYLQKQTIKIIGLG